MSVRLLSVAVGGAVLFAAVGLLEDAGEAGVARLVICGAALATAAACDLRARRIPNRVTIPAALALLVVWTAAGARPGRIAAGLLIAGVLLVIGLVRPDAIGMGDGKLALVVALGLLDKALIGLALGLLLAAVVAAPRLWRGRVGRSGAVPLGPFLASGAQIALLA
jgi:leader peptidase (prepilin peptidase)/N-methyltransferase